jgi:hypothetical protein
MEDMELVSRSRSSNDLLRNCFSCVVIPVGNISVGLCRHRALLYKVMQQITRNNDAIFFDYCLVILTVSYLLDVVLVT